MSDSALRVFEPDFAPEEHEQEIMGQSTVQDLNDKVAKILDRLEGEGDADPGLMSRVKQLEEIILGKDGNDGLSHQVRSLRRVKTWMLCTASACVGYVVDIAIKHFFH